MHDRSILRLCAYYASIESIFEEKQIHNVAEEKVNELNLLVIRTTGTWTAETNRKNVRYVGKYTAPMTAMKPFFNSEKIEETAEAYKKINIGNMYAIKVAKDTIGKEQIE